MLRKHLEFHWHTYVLPVLALVFLFALTFSSISLVHYGDRAVQISARQSTPPSDFLVYTEVGPAKDMATTLAENPNVEFVHVDAWRAAEAISASGNLPLVLRNLPPEALRIQALARGHYPAESNQIAITYQLAEMLEVDLGSYVTIAGDLVAERYLITGIYARSPFEDRLDSAFEGLVLNADPLFVAAHVDDSGQGGIEVRGKSAVSTQEVIDDILSMGNSVVIRADERFELIHNRQALGLSIITATVPWLQITGFLVSTTLLFLGLLAGMQHRNTEVRTLRALGVKKRAVAAMQIEELAVMTLLSGVLGLGIGLASAYGAVAILRSLPGGQYMPAALQAPAKAYIAAALLIVLATVVAHPLDIATSKAAKYRRCPRTILLIPLSVTVGAAAIYAAGLTLLLLPAPPPLMERARSVAIIVVLIAAVFSAVILFTAALTSRLHLGAPTHLIPRSRVGLVRVLALLVMFLSAASLGLMHTTTASLGAQDTSLHDRFDVAVRSRLGEFELTANQIDVAQTWDVADRTLALRTVNNDLPADDSFQPGPIYAVDQAEANHYFRGSVNLSGTLLVPRGTDAVPDTVTFTFVDNQHVQHEVSLVVVESPVPVALISTTDVPGLAVDEVWVRLVPGAIETISQTYPDFEERLAHDAPSTRPVITLSLGNVDPKRLNSGQLAMIIQSSVCAVLAFVVFVREPRSFLLYEAQNRTLRALGLSARRRQIRRLTDVALSGYIMLIAGAATGVATARLMLSDLATLGTSIHVPYAVLAGNIHIVMLVFMTFGAISTHADVARDTNREF